jgi:hypothetical protein
MESMKTVVLQRWIVGLMLLSFSFCLMTCGGPAAAPGPIAEVPAPAVLKFVSAEGLKVDITTLSEGGTLTPSLDVSKFMLPPNIPMKFFIQLGPTFADSVQTGLTTAIEGIEKLQIPISVRTTTFEIIINFGRGAGFLSDSQLHRVKLDFAAFDYDNSGAIDGIESECKGNTASLPICIRFWLDGKPFLAGIIGKHPIYSTNPRIPDFIGEGTFKIVMGGGDPARDTLLIAYKQLQAPGSPKEIEYFFKAGQQQMTQRGTATSTFKGINMSMDIYSGLYPTFLQYTGQFVEGVSLVGMRLFWGNGTPENPIEGDLFQEAPFDCATLAPDYMFLEDRTACASVDGESILVDPAVTPFLPQPDVAAYDPNGPLGWPTDFPATPTF